MGVLPDCASGTFCSSKEKTNVRVKRAEEEKKVGKKKKEQRRKEKGMEGWREK